MKKIAILLMLITIFSKILGLIRDIVLSYFYGASMVSDAYLIAITIPSVIFGFIATGISTGYIPLYREIENKHGWLESNKFSNNVINILLLVSTFILFLSLAFTEELVKLFASGFDEETLDLAVVFTKITMLGIYFSGLTIMFSAFLQIHGKYAITAMIGFPLNLVTLLAIYLSYQYDVIFLAVGATLAAGFQFALLVPFIYKQRYNYKFVLDFKNKYVKKLVIMAMPVILGASITQINILIDRTLASQIVIGGISALNYAYRLNGFVQGIVVTSISIAMYPIISKMVVEKNMAGLKKTINDSIGGIILLVLPATIGIMFFAEPIITLLFGRGAFDDQATILTSNALFFYAIGMIGYGLREVLSRAFYSLQDTKTPVINGAIAVVLNIVLNLILSYFMGLGGLALATSISSLFCTFLLIIKLRKRLGPLGLKAAFFSFLKILIASLIMGIIAKLVFNLFTIILTVHVSLVITLLFAILIYFVIVYFMKIEEVDLVLNVIKKKIVSKS
jgi:putative peptidoglycan lipid II flippase